MSRKFINAIKINPGKPKIATKTLVKGLIGKLIPKYSPIIPAKHSKTTAITELSINFNIDCNGEANNLASKNITNAEKTSKAISCSILSIMI